MSGLFGLDGQIAVVIGGTGVLGGAICHGLSEAGAAVAVLGRSLERANTRVAAIEAAGGRAVAVLVDSTSPDSVEAARQEVERLLGPADILVNAAGVNSSTPFLEIGLEEWHRILDADLTAVFVACQVFGRRMIERGTAGSIINISSASSGPPLSRVLAYSVAKAGVNSLTQYLAFELAPHHIRVNAIAPGFFPAEQNRALLSEERISSIIGHTPARRLGEPDELSGTVVWLASATASGFVTGAIIRVDGGFTAMTI
jgi:NAD(P)-dependent dehydrogenase (short-subunit alcohol dehydrogenase family)